jgi:hypothetical protein
MPKETVKEPKAFKQEPKTEIIKEPEPVVRDSNKPLVILSETDMYVHERMKSQPTTDEEVQVKFDMIDTAPAEHILSLPKELRKEKYAVKYAFRWVNKKKRAIDRALDVIGWSFVNRKAFPDVPDYIFTANGSIERGDAILTYMPLKQAEKIRTAPAQLSRERVKNTPVQNLKAWKDRGNDTHYKPDLGAAENDKEESRGLVIQPDNED